MISAILSLFGCNKKPRTLSVSTLENGPFTIEAVTTQGKAFNMNSGSYTYEKVSYGIKYKGQPLELADKLEVNTGVPGIWRVFSLKTASKPALIFGSQSLFLVTEENGSPQVKPLHAQYSDFASIQWLDSENGQPGMYREIYSSDKADTNNILDGGRYLIISHSTILDTKTFELFPFNPNNDVVDGYYLQQRGALAASPDSSQVVFIGSKQNESDYMEYDHALLSYNFKNQTSYSVPFEKKKLYVRDEFKLTPEWVNDYFEWIRVDDEYVLQLKKEMPRHIKGLTYFQRHQGFSYELYPVAEDMMHELAKFIKTELNLKDDQVVHEKEEYQNRYRITAPSITLIIEHDPTTNSIVLKENQPVPDHSVNKETIHRISKGFNALLQQGNFENLILTVD